MPASSTAKQPPKKPATPKSSLVADAPGNQMVVGHASRLRMFIAAVCGIIAITLVMASIMTVWLTRSILDTDKYTQTVEPLITDTNVQNFLATTATDTLLAQTPPEQVAAVVLKPEQIAGKTPDQLKQESAEVVNKAVLGLIGSEQFQEFWRKNNETLHAQLVSQLKGDTDTLTIDFSPLINGLVSQAQTTELGAVVPAGTITIPADKGKVSLTGGPLDTARQYYQMLQTAQIVLIVAAALAAVACVALSVQHLRTLRRILIGVAALSLGTALVLQAPSLVMWASKSAEQLAAASVVRILFSDLQQFLIVFGISCIVLALASKLYSRARKVA